MSVPRAGSAGGSAIFYSFGGLRLRNNSYINDPRIENAYQEIQKNIIVNFAKADEIYRELMPYLQEQAYYIPRPSPYSYVIWWPWLKNYHGETTVGLWLPFIWIDQNLKKSMGH